MTTKEAIQAIHKGKKVKAKTWDETEYIFISPNGNIIDENNELIGITNYNNWEICEEPKPKQTVSIEKWLCKCATSQSEYIVIERDAKYFSDGGYASQKVKLLDTYEVEI